MACCGQKTIIVDEAPLVKSDGSLLFNKKMAPAMPGYRHDVDNPRRLVPDVAPCATRITLPLLRNNGKYEILNQCNGVGCEQRGKQVNDEICAACLLRSV